MKLPNNYYNLLGIVSSLSSYFNITEEKATDLLRYMADMLMSLPDFNSLEKSGIENGENISVIENYRNRVQLCIPFFIADYIFKTEKKKDEVRKTLTEFQYKEEEKINLD